MLPITGGHFYLGDNPAYVTTNYNELVTNNGGPPTVWQDILWEFLALGNGDDRRWPTSGPTRAHLRGGREQGAHLPLDPQPRRAGHTSTRRSPPTTRWPRCSRKNGARTYVASNITGTPITVTFSNGTTLDRARRQDGHLGRVHLERRQRRRRRRNPTPDPSRRRRPAVASPPHRRRALADPPTHRTRRSTVATRYLVRSGGGLPATAGGGATTVTLAAANGNWDGTPAQPAGVHRHRPHRHAQRRRDDVRPVRRRGHRRSATAPRSGSPTTSPATAAGTGWRPTTTSPPTRCPATSTTPRRPACARRTGTLARHERRLRPTGGVERDRQRPDDRTGRRHLRPEQSVHCDHSLHVVLSLPGGGWSCVELRTATTRYLIGHRGPREAGQWRRGSSVTVWLAASHGASATSVARRTAAAPRPGRPGARCRRAAPAARP